MEKRTSALARILAALALVAAVVAIVVVIVAATGGGSSTSGGGHSSTRTTRQKPKKPKTKAKTYVVQTGDTLTSIAHETGISIATILKLNPGVDPQILIAGETLKLR